jgi:hypothetical protein
VKNQPIEFTHDIVDMVYKYLPYNNKFYTDEVGNIWKVDPVYIVRNYLIDQGYQLDQAWTLWGTTDPTQVTGVKNSDASIYVNIINDISSILQQIVIDEVLTENIVEQALFKALGEEEFNTIKSLEIKQTTDIVKLWHVEYLIQNLDVITLQGRTIQGKTLSTIKEQISRKITDRITSTFSGLSVESLNNKKAKNMKYGYELLKSVYMACLSFYLPVDKNTPAINRIKTILNGLTGNSIEVKFSTLLSTLRNEGRFQEKTVNGIREALMELRRQSKSYNYGFQLCSKAIEQTLVYNKKFHQSNKNNAYHKFFHEKWMRGYIVLSLLNQFLGFDPLTFQKLDDGIFLKTKEARMKYYTDKGYNGNEIKDLENIQYLLHHINLDSDADIRKLSFEVFDLILTNDRIHRSYEGLTETESRALVEGWNELLELDGDINMRQVQKIFEKVKVRDENNKLVPIYLKFGWFDNIRNFEKQLDLLNDMKDIRDNNGIEALIRNTNVGFPIAVDRWLGSDDFHQYLFGASQKIHYYLLEAFYQGTLPLNYRF